MEGLELLFHLAREARGRAYAPYSGYRVGAAIRAASGALFVASNVENASYGATICAERAAVCAMVAAGGVGEGRTVAEIAVATEDGGPPCGVCLQVLAEFAPPGALVHILPATGAGETVPLGALAPRAFASPRLRKTP